jgi:hypothetical protein
VLWGTGLREGDPRACLARPTSSGAVALLDETHVKRGDRVVGQDTELVEKLVVETRARAVPGGGFRTAAGAAAGFDGGNGHYYVRD